MDSNLAAAGRSPTRAQAVDGLRRHAPTPSGLSARRRRFTSGPSAQTASPRARSVRQATPRSSMFQCLSYTASLAAIDRQRVHLTVTVTPRLAVTASAQRQRINLGEASQLAAQVSREVPRYSYLWIPSSGLNATNIPTPLASPAVTTTYTVHITDSAGEINEASVRVDVNLGIDVSTNPSLISLNGISQLNAIATGGVSPTRICGRRPTAQRSDDREPVGRAPNNHAVHSSGDGCQRRHPDRRRRGRRDTGVARDRTSIGDIPRANVATQRQCRRRRWRLQGHRGLRRQGSAIRRAATRSRRPRRQQLTPSR